MMKEDTVLVTGASGYVAMHCIQQLLSQGYRVRGTLRHMARQPALREIFDQPAGAGERLTFVAADLLSDDGWDEAARDCAYVLHVASPLLRQPLADESEIIQPAVAGTTRVLQAALNAGVKRVVVTSSVAAIVHGQARHRGRPLDEGDWSDADADMSAYAKSKTLAERAAWEFARQHDALELVTINPGMVLGPLFNEHFSTSLEPVRRLMQGRYPGCPRLGWAFVDARDVAAAHIAAMTRPEAAGLRFCCVNRFAWLQEIAEILAAEFSAQGYRIPTRPLPDFAVRLVGVFDKTVRMTLHNLGQRFDYSTAQIQRVLGWQARPLDQSVIDTAYSLIKYDLL